MIAHDALPLASVAALQPPPLIEKLIVCPASGATGLTEASVRFAATVTGKFGIAVVGLPLSVRKVTTLPGPHVMTD